jgi:glycosyltransferase involved in cell wall biosynthesis
MNRVAIFPSAFHPSLGGVEELTGQLAVHLRNAGVDAIICTNRWPRNLPKLGSWKRIPVHRFPFRLPEAGFKSWLSFRISARRVLRSVCETLRSFGAEAIHVQCVSSNAWYACHAARILQIPLVVSVQGERTMDAQNLYGRSALYNRILKKALLSADRVTACSRATLDDLAGYNGTPFGRRARVVYNGVSPGELEMRGVQQQTRPYILAMGRMVPQKGFSQLLVAFSRSKAKFDLVLAGDGPQLDSLKALSEQLGLRTRVSFPGRADRELVAKLLHGASGLIVPSLREPMGIVALEGMAAGKPLIVSAVDGLQEIAPCSAWCRHVSPGDVESIAAGLEWLESLNGVSGQRLSAPMEWVKNFHWDTIAATYRETYLEAHGEFESRRLPSEGFLANSKAAPPGVLLASD